MRKLLESMGISVPFKSAGLSGFPTETALIGGSVLLVEEHRRSGGVSTEDFPDRTGYECFVNHIHLPYDGKRESLMACLACAEQVRGELERYTNGREFLIIVSVYADGCVVRFHECRPGESWLGGNLEAYTEEAILAICVTSAAGRCTS